MAKFTELDLEMAFNAGRTYEGGMPEHDDNAEIAFLNWLDNYTEDDENK